MQRSPRSWLWKTGILLDGLILGLLPLSAADPGSQTPSPQRESSYSETTLLLCNSRVAESVELAAYYAAARKIPSRNILELAVDPGEEISRAQYEAQIAGPLRNALMRQGWWMPERDEKSGTQALRSQFHFLVLFHGMPLRIAPSRPGEDVLQSSAASVDSELAALGHPGSATEGPVQNPYFRSELPFRQARTAIQLVGRIDGPSAAHCRRMIDDAIRTEREGIWGHAYIDLDRDGTFGNEWMGEVADQLRVLGVPVTVNRFAQPFPGGYPFKDPAFYFGWKEEAVSGPFSDPEFRFRPGAVAAHLTETSASSLRGERASWAGALIESGAAAVVGNVADPLLRLSHRFDILMDRLIKGHTLLESAYMANETLSWMGVVVGDPLYRPFPFPSEPVNEEHYQNDLMLPYKVTRLAYGRWGKGEPLADRELIMKLEMASAKLPRPELIEHLGLVSVELGNYREARTHFMRAKSKFEQGEDQLRMDLHLADLAWKQKDKLKAMKIWREASQEFRKLPESQAAVELMKQSQSAQP